MHKKLPPDFSDGSLCTFIPYTILIQHAVFDYIVVTQQFFHYSALHYAKLYAATIGCIGFMALKYKWGRLGKAEWFKCFPFVIVAINILIAVVSDFESAVRAFGTTWISTEGVELHGGWHNVFNGIAGILNIFVMTGWFGIYVSKKKQDMLWPDMTWVFIISYDIWNFCYTYNCLPTHSWYCGLALLLAPPWPACCGTRAAGSKTARTRWRCGACSARCAPCSPTTPSSPCSR